MPITTFHIGIPGLVGFYFPKRVDILSAIVGCVLIDIDFFISLAAGTLVHGFFHTILGASILSLFLIIIISLAKKPIRNIKKKFKWYPESEIFSISIGALLGTYSHVLLDSLLYREINLFFPIHGNQIYISTTPEIIYRLIYGITIFTTLLFLILYLWKYNKKS